MTRNMSKPPEWEQPTPLELKKMVRELILRHKDRHDQTMWVSNAFDGVVGCNTDPREYPVERIRALLRRRKSVPDEPMSPDSLCGTKACVAGWGALLGSPPDTILWQGHYIWDVNLRYPDGTTEDVEKAATRLMGMNEHQADWLFEARRTRREVLSGLAKLIKDPEAELFSELFS